jgi:hypothetical protein
MRQERGGQPQRRRCTGPAAGNWLRHRKGHAPDGCARAPRPSRCASVGDRTREEGREFRRRWLVGVTALVCELACGSCRFERSCGGFAVPHGARMIAVLCGELSCTPVGAGGLLVSVSRALVRLGSSNVGRLGRLRGRRRTVRCLLCPVRGRHGRIAELCLASCGSCYSLSRDARAEPGRLGGFHRAVPRVLGHGRSYLRSGGCEFQVPAPPSDPGLVTNTGWKAGVDAGLSG